MRWWKMKSGITPTSPPDFVLRQAPCIAIVRRTGKPTGKRRGRSEIVMAGRWGYLVRSEHRGLVGMSVGDYHGAAAAKVAAQKVMQRCLRERVK